MAVFTDRKNQEWTVRLTAPLIENIRELHGISLAKLDTDPLGAMRHDPMKLVAVIYLICEDQINERELDPKQFAELLPSPPDAMLTAIREAIIGFYPTSRADHVREVLDDFDKVSARLDAFALAKMRRVLEDPKTVARLEGRADTEVAKALDELFASEPST